MSRAAGICGTVGVHLALLLVLVPIGCTVAPKGEPPKAPPTGREPVSVRLLPSDPSPSTAACSKTYTGLGLRTVSGELVMDIAKGGPAEQAGVRVGDRLLNVWQFWPDRYPEGERVALHIVRGGASLTLAAIVRRVCYEEG